MILYIKNNSFVKLLSVLGVLFLLTSCEDVIEVDVAPSDERLVIDAEILWETGTTGNLQQIKLSRLTNYYNTETIKVSNAAIKITNVAGNVFNFTETDIAGTYQCTNFTPQLLETYTLEVIVEDEIYTATETMVPVPEINRIEQNDDGGFFEDEIEVSIFYNDPADETNYYLSDFSTPSLPFPEYVVTNDDLYNGNEIEDSYSKEELEVGDIIDIKFRGISEQFYNYMILILGSTNASPFATPPANIRGNIINETEIENYALGYFRLSKAHIFSYTVE